MKSCNFDVLLTVHFSIILATDQHVEDCNKLIIKQRICASNWSLAKKGINWVRPITSLEK
jgi:hypothetical protein